MAQRVPDALRSPFNPTIPQDFFYTPQQVADLSREIIRDNTVPSKETYFITYLEDLRVLLEALHQALTANPPNGQAIQQAESNIMVWYQRIGSTYLWAYMHGWTAVSKYIPFLAEHFGRPRAYRDDTKIPPISQFSNPARINRQNNSYNDRERSRSTTPSRRTTGWGRLRGRGRGRQ